MSEKRQKRPPIPASGPRGQPDPEVPAERGRRGADPGSYIGRLPERAADTVPGGLTRADERISGIATQAGPPTPEPDTPEGHREGESHNDARIREAGENR